MKDLNLRSPSLDAVSYLRMIHNIVTENNIWLEFAVGQGEDPRPGTLLCAVASTAVRVDVIKASIMRSQDIHT